MAVDEHRFGGEWTELKLAVIDAYSGFFSQALKNQTFTRWYIDGFAGTGRRTASVESGGLLTNEPLETKEVTLEGSARRALAVQPPYDHLVLIEARRQHAEALDAIAAEEPSRDINVLRGDANDVIPKLLSAPPWTGIGSSNQRALVFLDPYGINVCFSTLQALAASKKADVWLLVNLKAAVQQLAKDHAALDAGKRAALCRFFGTEEWEQAFYVFREGGTDLFSQPVGRSGHRMIDRYDVARFYRTRLSETFAYVSDPFSLKVGSHQDYFQLYCMSNNPSQRAQELIARGATSIMRKFAKASHRRSVP